MHHHSGHQNEPKSAGSDMCMVENREVENFSELDRATVVNHVWETCKPVSNISSTPTVSARRVKVTRVHLEKSVLKECGYVEDEPGANCQEGEREDREEKSILNTVKSLAAALVYPTGENEGEEGAGEEDENGEECDDDNQNNERDDAPVNDDDC